jgi:hypothetical protein
MRLKTDLDYTSIDESMFPYLELLYAILTNYNDGFPCEGCKLKNYCADTGRECRDFKRFVNRRTT